MYTPRLLTRDAFREGVFERDGHKCVLCKAPFNDKFSAHHIIERRLWTAPHQFGGYFLDNGATVCEPCHIKCERTDVTVEEVREAAGITRKPLPEHLYEDQVYDKWANIIMPNGTRLRGELFFDGSVQKVIADHLHEFTHHVKAPRTWHLPWSPGMHDDDRMLRDMAPFIGKRVIATRKMDGENTTMYSDYIHARSLDGRHHPSRDWVKQFHAKRAYNIPEFWRIGGENVYAEHSIRYEDLKSFFLGFHVWNEKNVALAWDEALEWFELLDITPVDVLYDGIYDEKAIRAIEANLNWDRDEGYVLRVADSFSYGEYKTHVGKFVRKDHVRTTKHHWQAQAVIPNKLAVAA